METKANLPILGFADVTAFLSWLGKQPTTAPGLWLKVAKQGSDIASLT